MSKRQKALEAKLTAQQRKAAYMLVENELNMYNECDFKIILEAI